MEELTGLIEKLSQSFEQFKTNYTDRLDHLEARMNRPGAGRARRGDDLGSEFSILNAIKFLADPTQKSEVSRELEISRELQRRFGITPPNNGLLMPLGALSEKAVTFGGTGEDLVATDHMAGSFIDVLRNRSVIMNLRPTILPNLVGNVSIPRKTGSSAAHWFAADHSDSITESTPTFDSLSFSPKFCGGLVVVSYRVTQQATPDIEDIIRRDLAAMLAVEIDAKAINGDGTGNAPRGILKTEGIDSNTYNPASSEPRFSHIVNLETVLASKNADQGNLAYLTTPGIAGEMKQRDLGADGEGVTGKFVWQPSPGVPGKGVMNGYPAYASNNVPEGYLVFGNWEDLVIGMWGAVALAVDPYGSNFAKGSVSIRAIIAVDFGVRHAESFAEIHPQE
ncbi:phage major capsid protein [bacterium]|nr:phage major capsid protein [bacterium]